MPCVNRRQAVVGALGAAFLTQLATSARAQQENETVTVAELQHLAEDPAGLAAALYGVLTFIYIASVVLDHGDRLAESVDQFRMLGSSVFAERAAIADALRSADTLQSLARYRPRIDAMKKEASATLAKGAIGDGPVRRSLLRDVDMVTQLLAAGPRHEEDWWCHCYALRRFPKC